MTNIEHAFAELARGESAAFLAVLADDITWTHTGTIAWSGTLRGKPAVLAMLRDVAGRVAGHYRVRLVRTIIADPYIVVEARGDNVLHSGARYDNEYCWICRVAGGAIVEVVEYCDTELVTRVLGAPERST